MDIHNNEDFAKKYWAEFEKLVLKLLQSELENADDNYTYYSRKTQNQKDGGYDGIIIIEPKDSFVNNLDDLYIIITEAKLRKNANKDLPLSDFSKTLLIAINCCATEVYVYTNLHFSSKTQLQVKKFSNATFLNVKLIDIFQICEGLKKYTDIKKEYPKEFIDTLFEALKLHDINKKINYKQDSLIMDKLPKIVGDKRKSIYTKYKEYVKDQKGVCIISGIQGSGKSLIIKHIINNSAKHCNCNIIQLEKFTSIKGFFVYLLSLIWNIDVVSIYGLTKENIDEIVQYMPQQYMPQRVKAILLNILENTSTEYENRQDVFEEHLIEYLYYIFIPICNRRKQLFVFTNFEKCTDNILNFTNKFIRKFASENIIILIEIRSDIPHLKKFADDWALLNEQIEPVELSEFNEIEFMQYIEHKYPDLDFETTKNLYSICFPLPLYIDNLLSFIKTNDIENLLVSSELNIKKLYNNDKFKEKCISYSLKVYFRSQSKYCRMLAFLLVFFDGELSLESINKIGNDFSDAAIILSNSIYFDLIGANLKIHHMIYLLSLQKNNLLSPFEYNEVMLLLYGIIESFEIDKGIIRLKKLIIAIELHDKDFIAMNWEILCNDLIKQNDFSVALNILKKIYNNDFINKYKKLHLINTIITCYLGLNDHNSQDLKTYIAVGNTIIWESLSQQEKLSFYYLKCKYFFVTGQYTKAISETNPFRNTNAHIRYIRALSIKHIYGIEACLLSLQRGIQHFPNDWHIKYSHLDHLHSKFEKINYDISWQYLIEIEQYFNQLTLEGQIHYQYNKIALDFYKNGADNIQSCKKLLLKTFENILPVEEARIRNLIGQIYYINNVLDLAESEFIKSFEILNQHIHVTYIYISLTNLVLLYDLQNEHTTCIAYAKRTLDFLFQYKKEKITRQLAQFNKDIIIEKECASFIVIMEIIKKYDKELFNEYNCKFEKYDCTCHLSAALPEFYYVQDKITFRC